MLWSQRWVFFCALALLSTACGQLDFGAGPLLYDVTVAPDLITPNADHDQDVTNIAYTLRRNATVSIFFEDTEGERFYFRKEKRRAAGRYSVQWGGTVDKPEIIETDYGTEEILSRVLSDGLYTWTIEAVDDSGTTESFNGSITLQDGDTEMPQLRSFAVVPRVFTPNQDVLDDRVSISYYLTKDVNTKTVYLVNPDEPDVKYFISEKPGVEEPNIRGNHDHDYDGGVDQNAEPPPDGDYIVYVEVHDLAGNAIRVSGNLTIKEGGKPRADIAEGEIDWENEVNRRVTVALGEKLCFSTVVVNEGTVPLRTSGPWPGAEYHFGQNYNTLAAEVDDKSWRHQPGVWRFAINFESTEFNFPYRWAVGRKEDLEMRIDSRGNEQWYLMPGKRGRTSGCIIIDEEPPLSADVWWGGLIHQSVAVANDNVDRIEVRVDAP